MTKEASSRISGVLPDLLVIGIAGRCTRTGSPDLAAVRSGLEAQGAQVQRQTDPVAVRALLPLRNEEGDAVGSAQLDLHFVNVSAGWHLGDRSSIRVNPQKVARELLREDHECGDEGFGSSTNIIPIPLAGPEMTDWILGLVEDSFSDALKAIKAAAGAKLGGDAQIWLKTIEICRDLSRPDAVADMHVLKGTMLEHAVGKLIDVYREVERAAFENTKGLISLRFLTGRGRTVYKVYAKRRDVLRLEIACPDRSAVAALIGRERLPPSGKNARRLVAGVMAEAETLIDRLQEHVEAALASRASPAELMIELQDLVRLAAGLPGSKGPAPSPASTRQATDALNGILCDGWFNASGIPANVPVRKVLEKLVESDGVLIRRPGKAIYCLHPQFAAAPQAIS